MKRKEMLSMTCDEGVGAGTAELLGEQLAAAGDLGAEAAHAGNAGRAHCLVLVHHLAAFLRKQRVRVVADLRGYSVQTSITKKSWSFFREQLNIRPSE